MGFDLYRIVVKSHGVRANESQMILVPFFIMEESKNFISLKSLTTTYLFIACGNNFFCRLNTHAHKRTQAVVKFGIWKFLLGASFACSFWVSLNLCSKSFLDESQLPGGQLGNNLTKLIEPIQQILAVFVFFCISAIRETVTEAACQAKFMQNACWESHSYKINMPLRLTLNHSLWAKKMVHFGKCYKF